MLKAAVGLPVVSRGGFKCAVGWTPDSNGDFGCSAKEWWIDVSNFAVHSTIPASPVVSPPDHNYHAGVAPCEVEDPSQVIFSIMFSLMLRHRAISLFFSPSLTKSNTPIWRGLNRWLISAPASWSFEVSIIVLTMIARLTNAELCCNPRRA
jgi:hypothetical protein